MTNEVKNVPELRFPNFSEEWKKFVFKDQIISIEKGTDLLGSEDNMGIPLIKMGNIKRGYFSFNKLEKLRESETIQEKYYIKKGDFLFNTRNTMELVGKSATWTNKSDKFAFNSNIARIVLKDIDTYFFNYLYNTSKMINKVKSLAVGTTSVAAIYPRDLNHLNYFLPLIAEQEKIGEFFSKLDRQIELEEQKLAKLEEQKKGYMQQIFSQELRFKDEDGNDYTEWKTKKLDELGEFNSGVGFPEKYQGGNTGVPFFKVSDMNLLGNEKFMNTANNYVSIEQIKQKKWKVIQSVPAIIFAKVGAAIMLNRKRMILNPFLIDNNTMSYSFSNHWDTNFGYVVFQMLNLPKYAQVGALPSYNSKDIGIIQIRLPIKEEQEKIGDFFSKLDEHINKQNQKIAGLKLRKQGFLQKMFV